MNAAQVAKIFGCTAEQAKAQYARNAASLREDAAKARKTGKKLRGYTAEQFDRDAERMEAGARGEEVVPCVS